MSLTAQQINPQFAISALQRLALHGVAHWLGKENAGPSLGSENQAEIAALLAKSGDLTKAQIRAARQLSRRFLISNSPEWTTTQTRWVADRFEAGVVHKAIDWVTERIARLRGQSGVHFAPVAPLLIDALATDAWTDPTFRRNMAALIRDHVSGQVILYPDNGKTPILAIPCLWAATADALSQTPDATTPNGIRVQQKVNQRAAALCAAEGWAGFWDGYAMEYARAHGRPVPKTALTLHLSTHPDTPPQFQKDWRDGIPGYANPLLENAILNPRRLARYV